MKRLAAIVVMLVHGVAISSGQGTAPPPLNRYVGKWDGFAVKSTASDVSGSGNIESRRMQIVVTQPSPGIVELRGNIWDVTATLAQETRGTGKYSLSYKADYLPQVTAMPLSYSGTDGWSGTVTFTKDGKQFEAKASIKEMNGESKWTLEVKQATTGWGLIMSFGKAQ